MVNKSGANMKGNTSRTSSVNQNLGFAQQIYSVYSSFNIITNPRPLSMLCQSEPTGMAKETCKSEKKIKEKIKSKYLSAVQKRPVF